MRWIRIGAGSGAAAVLLGAFGAHGLKGRLADAAEGAARLGWWETGAHYHLVHSVAVLAVSLWLGACARPGQIEGSGSGARQSALRGTEERLASAGGLQWAWARAALIAWCLGMLVFSGTLYVMALSGLRWLGAVTPIGGVLLTAGWLLLAVGVRRPRAHGSD